jgi:hypothetical protein
MELCDLTVKEMFMKQSQKKLDSLFKPVSTVTTKPMSP